MDDFLYIIIGLGLFAFNIYRASQKAKNAKAKQMQQHNMERNQNQEHKANNPIDILDTLEEILTQTPKQEDVVTQTNETNDYYQHNQEELETKEEKITETESKEKIVAEKKNDIKSRKNKSKFNLKQAIIYNTILERKYF